MMMSSRSWLGLDLTCMTEGLCGALVKWIVCKSFFCFMTLFSLHNMVAGLPGVLINTTAAK